MDTHNPFAPPSADLDEAPPEADIRKPISVWVVQVVGVVAAVWAALGLALFAKHSSPLQSVSRLGIPVWLQLILQTCLVLALLLMLWQLPRRSRLGRNLGLGLISLFALPSVLTAFNTQSPDPYYAAGRLFAVVVVTLPVAYWGFAFAFSEKARRYFSALASNGQ